ncbi:MAG: YidC/Oxa1 family membrane protein insertase [Actinomycetota bacterium]|nr:YidC/Oxa1 family membrane protein insertase [Actinomycetota bacterium]
MGDYIAGMALTGRTAGQAVQGLRMVDEVPHLRPGWRAATIRWAVRQPPQVLLITVSGWPSVRRALEQLRELQPDIDELRSRHGSNDDEFNQSLVDLYSARGMAPFSGWWPLLATMLAGVAYDGVHHRGSIACI